MLAAKGSQSARQACCVLPESSPCNSACIRAPACGTACQAESTAGHSGLLSMAAEHPCRTELG